MKSSPALILLLILGMILLMLGFSGRYAAILKAAFPGSGGGGTSSTPFVSAQTAGQLGATNPNGSSQLNPGFVTGTVAPTRVPGTGVVAPP